MRPTWLSFRLDLHARSGTLLPVLRRARQADLPTEQGWKMRGRSFLVSLISPSRVAKGSISFHSVWLLLAGPTLAAPHRHVAGGARAQR